jgi:hypothetical protein
MISSIGSVEAALAEARRAGTPRGRARVEFVREVVRCARVDAGLRSRGRPEHLPVLEGRLSRLDGHVYRSTTWMTVLYAACLVFVVATCVGLLDPHLADGASVRGWVGAGLAIAVLLGAAGAAMWRRARVLVTVIVALSSTPIGPRRVAKFRAHAGFIAPTSEVWLVSRAGFSGEGLAAARAASMRGLVLFGKQLVDARAPTASRAG